MKKLLFIMSAMACSGSLAFASTPRVVATCLSDGNSLKAKYRVVVSEIFGEPHLGYWPHYYQAEMTALGEGGSVSIGSFAAKYFPPNSDSYQSSQYYKGRRFLLKLFTDRKLRPDGKTQALLEARGPDGTDYSEKMLCSIAKLMVF